MRRGYIVLIAILIAAGASVATMYRRVASAPHTTFLYFTVRDKASGLPVPHAQVHVTGQGGPVSFLTDKNGTAVMPIVLAPDRADSTRIGVSADKYKQFEGTVSTIAPQLTSLSGDRKGAEATILLDRAGPPAISIREAKVAEVCHFYGEENQGGPAWNQDKVCVIPNANLLDPNYHQTDFICCGGGASSSATGSDIPPGLEVRASGGHYWSVQAPSLNGDQFRIHMYCGPEPAPGPGCNVDVEVLAHYRL